MGYICIYSKYRPHHDSFVLNWGYALINIVFISKLDWEPSCLFNSGLRLKMCNSSLTRSFVMLSAESKISTFAVSMTWPLFVSVCCLHADFEFFASCSLSQWYSIRSVIPMYSTPHVVHFNLYTTLDLSSAFLMLSLNGNILPMFIGDWNATLKSTCV